MFRPSFANFLETPQGTIRRYVHNVVGYTDHTCNDIQIVSCYYEKQAALDEIKKNPECWYQCAIISDAQHDEYPLREVVGSLSPPPLDKTRQA